MRGEEATARHKAGERTVNLTDELPKGTIPDVDFASAARRRAALELAAVVATGGLHLLFESVLHAKAAFIAAAGIGWCSYLVWRARREPDVLRVWGFRRDNLAPALRRAALASVPCAAFLLCLTAILGHEIPLVPLAWMLALYPFWGLVQQFLLQAIVASNIARVAGRKLPAVLIAATLFGVVHAPDWALCGLTFGVGLIFIPLWFWTPNILPLGLFHGWLGALAYLGVLGRDPWAEILKELR